MIVQKLIIDKSKSSQFQLVLRDETGEFTNSNKTGYGGINGNPPANINRYIFTILNRNTTDRFTHIQGRDSLNTNEFTVPSIEQIVAKEDIYINPGEFNKELFNVGVLEVTMNVEFNTVILGEGFTGSQVIANVNGAQAIFNNYTTIVANNKVYYIRGVAGSNLMLDRPLEDDFTEFKPSLTTKQNYVLYDNMEDCITKKLKSYLNDCGCPDNKVLNSLSELYLLDWGIKRSIEVEDFLQAEDYIDLTYKVCSSSKCGC